MSEDQVREPKTDVSSTAMTILSTLGAAIANRALRQITVLVIKEERFIVIVLAAAKIFSNPTWARHDHWLLLAAGGHDRWARGLTAARGPPSLGPRGGQNGSRRDARAGRPHALARVPCGTSSASIRPFSTQDQPLRRARRRCEGTDDLDDRTVLDDLAHIGRFAGQGGAG
jgi:hypothetical protein